MSCRCSSSAQYRWGCSTSWLKEYALQRQSFGSAFCFEDDRTDTQTHAHRIMRYRARLCEPEPRPHELAYMPALRAGLRSLLTAAPQKGALRAALLPLVGFCATAQGSASPNPARTKPPKNPTFLAGLRFEPCSGTTKVRTSCCPFCRRSDFALRARLCEPEPRPHERTLIPTSLAGLRSLLTTAPKKGAHFDMCSLFWCRWSDSNRHGIATTGF